MNRSRKADLVTSRSISCISEGLHPFNLVLISDRQQVATAAEAIVLRLLSKCLPLLDIHKDQWSSSELAHPEFAKEAIELAAHCDMLVIATADEEGLAPATISWLDSWLTNRAKVETALVSCVLARSTVGKRSSVHEYLQRLAEQYELAFFATGLAGSPDLRPDEIRTRSENPVLNYKPQPDGWGINE